MKRYFLAVFATLDDYAAIQNDFTPYLKGRWEAEEKLHATLYFFGGKFSEETLLEMLEAVDFTIEPSVIAGMELFKKGQILCVRSENPSLQRLHNELAVLFGKPQHPFIPHITLMRIKKVLDAGALERQMQSYDKRTVGRLDKSVALVESTLLPAGAQYRIVKRLS